MFKRTLKLSGALLSGWLVAMIWAMLFTTFLGATTKYPIVGVLISAIVILSYLAIIYNTTWRQGFKDRNMVNTGHIKNAPLLGLNAGLLATVPSLLVAAWYFISRYLLPDTFFVTNVVVRVWNLIYLQLLAATLETAPYVLLLVLIPMPLAAQLGYTLGLKDFSIGSKVVYVNKKKK